MSTSGDIHIHTVLPEAKATKGAPSELIDKYFELEKEILESHGVKPRWRILPLTDNRKMFWDIDSSGVVGFADTEQELQEETGNYYTEMSLSAGIHRGHEYTLIAVDTQCDGNQLLRIFSNANERKR